MNSGIGSYLILILLFWMIFSIISMQKRNSKNKKMLDILSKFDDRDTFFEQADEYISTEKDAEYNTKLQVLRLWGYTFYEEDEKFREQLEALDLNPILFKGNKSNFSSNEDSFFYLFVAIPNRLYYRNRDDLRQLMTEKMAAYDSALSDTMLKAINEAAARFYTKTEDCGKEFFRILVNGEYSGMRYSKQLIGLYKQTAEIFLSKMAQDENDEETFKGYLDDLKSFSQTRLGGRLIKEIGVVLPEEPAEETAEEAEEAEAAAEEPETAEEPVSSEEETAEPAEEEPAEGEEAEEEQE